MRFVSEMENFVERYFVSAFFREIKSFKYNNQRVMNIGTKEYQV